MMMRSSILSLGLIVVSTYAFTVTNVPSFSCRNTVLLSAIKTPSSSSSSTTPGVTTRHSFLREATFLVVTAATATTAATVPFAAMAASNVVTLPSGVSYEIIKTGDGAQPKIGELAAIRFNAYNGDIKIDDIFDTPEPYYTRVGSGGMLKGVEEVLPLMKLGDRWKLTIPGNLAFGSKGRPSSAGKPRIQPDATIVFEVEMVGLPGREPELIDLIGD